MPKPFPNSPGKNLENNARSQKFRHLMESACESLEYASDPPLPAMGGSSQGLTGHTAHPAGQLETLGYLQGGDVLKQQHVVTVVSH